MSEHGATGGLATWSVRRPVAALMLFVGLGLLGVISYRSLPVQLMPDFESPELFVSASLSGASPDEIENDLLRPLEGELATIPGIDEMTSVARNGSGTVTLAFERDVDLDHANIKVQQVLESVQARLPEQANLNVNQFDTSDFSQFIMVLSFRGDTDLETMAKLTEDELIPILTAVDGVVNVSSLGGASKQIGVFLQPERAQGMGVSVLQVQQALQTVSTPVVSVGDIDDGVQRLPVLLDGRARTMSDVLSTPVGGDRLKLGQVTRVEPGIAMNAERYRVDGRTSVGLMAYKEPQANLIEVAHGLRARIEQFNRERANEGLEVSIDFDSAELIEENLALLIERATVGALLSLIVLLVFLRGLPPLVVLGVGLPASVLAVMGHERIALGVALLVLLLIKGARPVLVVAIAAPTSLLIACDMFALADMTINLLTLLGLALSIGMLLDNSIVVLESISARRQAGVVGAAAAESGASRVLRSILAGTATTLVVFAPLAFLDIEGGELLRELALSVSFPLIASLLVAAILVPAATAWLSAELKQAQPVRLPGEHGVPRPSAARAAYSALLRFTLRSPGLCFFIGLGLVVISLIVGGPLLLVFAEGERPSTNQIRVEIEMPPGSSIDATDDLAKLVEEIAGEIDGRDEIQTTIRKEVATVTVVFPEEDEREIPVDIPKIRRDLRKRVDQVPAGRADIQVDPPPDDGGGGPGGLPGSGGTVESVRVLGPAGADLVEHARLIKERLEQLGDISNVRWDVDSGQPALLVKADRSRLSEHGVSAQELMQVIWATRREGEGMLTPFRLGEEDIDIVLWVEEAEERELEDIRRFPLVTSTGGRIPLEALATVTTGSEASDLRRHHRQRAITLRYGFDERAVSSGQATNAARQAVDQAVASLPPPPGVHVEVEHADEQLSDGWRAFWLALGLVFMVLAMSFESLVQPFLILVCVPLAAVGAIWVMVITGTSVNVYVVLAALVLLGIVVNNGILLVDRSQALVSSGVRRTTAVMRAAHERLRPVLMTATTTIIGMVPLSVDTGGQWELWPPFARAVIGGLAASTLISLALIPAGILVFAKLGELLEQLGVLLTLFALGIGAALFWGAIEADLLVSKPLMAVLAPCVALFFLWVTRLVQASWRGENAPAPVPAGAMDVHVRNTRKIYGRPPRWMRDWRVLRRWKELAGRYGLTASELAPPRKGRESAAWQVLLLALIVYLHGLTDSAWGLFLLSLPTIWLFDALVGSVLQALGRPGVWPPPGKWRRAWRIVEGLALVGYVWFNLRIGQPEDILTLVVVGLIVAVHVIFQLCCEGGLIGFLGRKLAPEPVVALQGVDLQLESGLYGLLGPNGAGKSTLMRLMVNLFEPSRGRLSFNGHYLDEHGEMLQPTIGYLPQSFGTPPHLTAREYLHHQALLAGHSDTTRRTGLVEEVLAKVGLTDRADEKVGGYSGGMRQRVGIARTLLNLPQLVVVDEPTVGLDPKERIRFRNLLGDLAKDRTVLLSTHVVEDIGSSCREVIVMDGGAVLFRGAPAEFAEKATGKAWVLEIQESQLDDFTVKHRVVSTTRRPGGVVRVRAVGEPPEGAEVVTPTMEDAYLLELGKGARELGDVAA
ncbi:MAG: efflux RND transporter permease subunit [Acidobacteriota bacterium]